jgi:hypothetical protein
MHLDYMMKPEYRAKLSYMLNDTAIVLVHDGQKARKFYNGKYRKSRKILMQPGIQALVHSTLYASLSN